MNRAIIAVTTYAILLSTVTTFAETVPQLSYDYTATASSGYKWYHYDHWETGTRTETLHNMMANTCVWVEPWMGGSSVFQSDTDQFLLEGVFQGWINPYGIWAANELTGTVTVDSSISNPQLTVTLTTYYQQNARIVIGENGFDTILLDYSGLGQHSFTIPVYQNHQIDFHIWQSMGSPDAPVWNPSWPETNKSQVYVDFSVTPEPCSLLLLALGTLALRKHKT